MLTKEMHRGDEKTVESQALAPSVAAIEDTSSRRSC